MRKEYTDMLRKDEIVGFHIKLFQSQVIWMQITFEVTLRKSFITATKDL